MKFADMVSVSRFTCNFTLLCGRSAPAVRRRFSDFYYYTQRFHFQSDTTSHVFNQPCVRCTAASVQPAVRLAVTRSPLQPRGAFLVSTSILEPPLKTASFYPVFETAKTDLTRKEMLRF